MSSSFWFLFFHTLYCFSNLLLLGLLDLKWHQLVLLTLVGQMDNYLIAGAKLIIQSLSAARLAYVDDYFEIDRAFIFCLKCMADSIYFSVISLHLILFQS